MVAAAALSAALAAAAPGQTAPPTAARFAGEGTTVAVNRADGRVAVMLGSTLSVYPVVGAALPAASFEIPGTAPAVLEFRGSQILYTTHDVNQMPVVFVAVSAEGRERLAWPNPGISELFPTETSRLTLDGKGVYGFLALGPEARAFFGMAEDIPLGAGVAATFRFAGEKLLARGSEAFAGVVALSPDDMLLALRGGGMMRVRPPSGMAWKREGKGGDWRIVDVDLKSGIAVAVDGEGAAVGTGIESGDPRWRCSVTGARVVDARLLGDGRLLVLSAGASRATAILDPATGRSAGLQPSELCARQGIPAAFDSWLGAAGSLAGLLEVRLSGSPAFLLRASDGWREVRVVEETPTAAAK